MGRILDARGDEAFDILDQLMVIMENLGRDPEITAAFGKGSGLSISAAARLLLKTHRDDVYALMALDDGLTVEEERGILSSVSIPLKLVRLMNAPAVRELLFGSAATNNNAIGSSAASENGNG